MPDALDRRIDCPAIRQGHPAAEGGARRRRPDFVARLLPPLARRRRRQAPAGQKPGAATRQAAPAGNPIEAQLAEVKKRLSITAAQQPQFDQFATIVKQNAQTMDALMKKATAQDAQQNAVEGLRTAASFAQTEADNLKRLVPALEALYASLSEQQKRAADKLFSSAPSSGAPASGGQQGRPKG